ncbi:hypothetical protein OIE66_09810 [Nonomuraea sp. NBC_01738]|nr:hypothetical protein OIE66_09810 [Nonomuraea sp. NBC_01738]
MAGSTGAGAVSAGEAALVESSAGAGSSFAGAPVEATASGFVS